MYPSTPLLCFALCFRRSRENVSTGEAALQNDMSVTYNVVVTAGESAADQTLSICVCVCANKLCLYVFLSASVCVSERV